MTTFIKIDASGLIIGCLKLEGDDINPPSDFIDVGNWAGFDERPSKRFDAYYISNNIVWTDRGANSLSSNSLRKLRDQLLVASDGKIMPYLELQQPVPSAWIQYRQLLRNVPQQSGFPDSVVWPELPT